MSIKSITFIITLSIIMFISCNHNYHDHIHIIGNLSKDPTITITQQPDSIEQGDTTCSIVIAQTNNVIMEHTRVAFYDSSTSSLANCGGGGYSVKINHDGIANFDVPSGITCFAIAVDIGNNLPVMIPAQLEWKKANELVKNLCWVIASSVPNDEQ
ncbi:MAG: hypothetical protein U9N55_05200 [candidate division Zixibacteria bacterium]|nr:hypothetical protein [candidate division Zixibacteria bacterium]